MLEIGTRTGRRPLGTQRERLVRAILERVHLLLDDVRGLPDRADEEGRRLHQRRAHFPEPVAPDHVSEDRLEAMPTGALGRQDVVHALDRAQLAHAQRIRGPLADCNRQRRALS